MRKVGIRKTGVARTVSDGGGASRQPSLFSGDFAQSPKIRDEEIDKGIRITTLPNIESVSMSFSKFWKCIVDARIEPQDIQKVLDVYEDQVWVYARMMKKRIDLVDLKKLIALLLKATPSTPHALVRKLLEHVCGFLLSDEVLPVIRKMSVSAVAQPKELIPESCPPVDRSEFLWAYIDSMATLMLPFSQQQQQSLGPQDQDDSIMVLNANEVLVSPPVSDDDDDGDDEDDDEGIVVTLPSPDGPEVSVGLLVDLPSSLNPESVRQARARVLEIHENALRERAQEEPAFAYHELFYSVPVGGSLPLMQILNVVDSERLPLNFRWITAREFVPPELRQGTEDIHSCCDCVDACVLGKCPCANENRFGDRVVFPYDAEGHLVLPLEEEGSLMIVECNSKCYCGSTCGLKVTQMEHNIPEVQLFRTASCGWGVRALQYIPRGHFIAEYVGEVVCGEEAQRRATEQDERKCSYMFDIDFHVEGEEDGAAAGGATNDSGVPNSTLLSIDAEPCGNFSRFFNHHHDPNMVIFNIQSDDLRPSHLHICFFSCKDIWPFEELTFDYKYELALDDEDRIDCHCGAKSCPGRLR